MKKLLLLFLFSIALFATQNSQAQYVTIPDTNFVQWLYNNGYAGCMNGNMMDTTCGAVVNETYVDCAYQNISDLTGIQYFDDLSTLYCEYNNLVSLPILPNSLEYLECRNNNLTMLPPLPNSMYFLSCYLNQLTSLPTLPSALSYLDCHFNQLSSLPFLPSNLSSLQCAGNQIGVLMNLPVSLWSLSCGYNHLTSLPSLPVSLVAFACEYNQIETIPNLPNSLKNLICGHNLLKTLPTLPNSITYLKCEYNQLETLPFLPDSLYYFNCSNNTNLNCLPKLKTIYNFNFSNIGVLCLPNYGSVSISNPPLSTLPLCIPLSGNGCVVHWKMQGIVYADKNSNCIFDNGENKYSSIKLLLSDTNNSVLQQTYTGGEGLYTFDTDTGYYKIKIDTSNLHLLVSCPVSTEHNIHVQSIDSFYYNKNFALSCKPGFDIGVSSIIQDSGLIRPANFANIKFLAGDMSNHYGLHCAAGVSGAVQVVMSGPATYIGTVNGALTPTVSGDTLTYTIADFGTVDFDNDFQIQVQTGTLAQLGDQVCFTVNVTPTQGDNNPANNTLTHCFTVVNSYDPNDKSVYPIERIENANGKLTYTVRFQNTGNAPAQHIYVMDTLDAALDVSTFELLAYSHQPQVQLIGHNLRFNFPNINLPDSTNDEPGSHGYVQYSIKLHDSLPLGTTINNTAFIYFDFNPPVQTNTVNDTLTDCDNLIANAWFAKTSLCKGDTLFAAMELHYPYNNIKWYVDNVLTTTGDSVAINSIGLGTHTIKVVIKTPYCLSKTYYTITVNDLPQPSLGNDTTACAGLVFDGGAGFTNYLWSTGATTQTIIATTSAAYIVTVTDANGCINSDVVVATINANPIISLGSDTTTCSMPVIFNVYGANLNYLWNTGSTSSGIVADTSGLYYVVVTDTNGCATSDSVMFINNPIPAKPAITVNGFTLSSSSATGNQWFINGSLIPNATSQAHTAAQPGWYSVSVTDTNGCHALSDSVFVTNTGTSQYSTPYGIEVIPNIMQGFIDITIPSTEYFIRTRLVDMVGNVIYETGAKSGSSKQRIEDLWPAKGIYIIEVITNEQLATLRIFIP